MFFLREPFYTWQSFVFLACVVLLLTSWCFETWVSLPCDCIIACLITQELVLRRSTLCDTLAKGPWLSVHEFHVIPKSWLLLENRCNFTIIVLVFSIVKIVSKIHIFFLFEICSDDWILQRSSYFVEKSFDDNIVSWIRFPCPTLAQVIPRRKEYTQPYLLRCFKPACSCKLVTILGCAHFYKYM